MSKKLYYLFLICILALGFLSCSEKEETIIEPEVAKVLPVINVDSIFINLDKEIIKKK